ncbi:uncharacterized protein LOC125074535 [Vanessa atalanta]|uniref:uncharacterized protein LOC125074535 n=1 Tax=Vanessa atalanta TaxID=42275 RepID=UPI001FCDA054|nr:uncharacterized protein LOC125074535 [Vanessa atalanta]
MMKQIKHRAVIKFLTKQGKTQKIIHEEMLAVYQDSAPSLFTIQKWSSEFKRGRESIGDDPRAVGPICVATEENVKLVEKLVLEDARVRVKTLAEMTKLSVGTIHTILHEHRNLSTVSARWVPRMLTALQKQVRVDCCKEFWTSVVKIRKVLLLHDNAPVHKARLAQAAVQGQHLDS